MADLPDIQPVQKKKRAPKRTVAVKNMDSLPDIDIRQPVAPSVPVANSEAEANAPSPPPAPKKRRVAPVKEPEPDINLDTKFQKMEDSMRETISQKLTLSKQERSEADRLHMEKFDLLHQSNQALAKKVEALGSELDAKHTGLLAYFEDNRKKKQQAIKDEKERELYERMKYGGASAPDRHVFAWPNASRNYY
jgi:hypothetical protein